MRLDHGVVLMALGHLEDRVRSDVRGHHDDRVREVDRAALAIGQAAVVQQLQQHIRYIGVRLLHLVEEHDAIRPTPHGLGELPALVVTDIAGRRADEPRHGVLLHVLAHVDAHDGLFGVEEISSERLAELRLADARRPEEEERSDRTVRLAEPRAVATHGLADSTDRLALPDDALRELVLHVQQLLALALDELRDGNARPLGDDLGDLLAVDLFLHKRGALGLTTAERLLGRLQALLEIAQVAVLDARRALEVAAALRLLELDVLLLDLGLHALDGVELLLLNLPSRGHRAVLLVEVGELLLDRAEALLALGVLLELERLALDLELHHAALDLVELRWHRVVLDAQLRRRFIEQIDRLVRQEAVCDVALRQRRGRDDRAVLDAHAVVRLVALLEAAQNRDRVGEARLTDEHRLEPPLERGVLLDMLAVLVERRRADAAELAARKRRLQQLPRADSAFALPCADDRVELVDEQDDAALARRDLAEHGLQALFELAAILGAREQLADIERDDARLAHRLWAVAVHDADRESLGDRGLADARLADQHGIVLRTPRQDLHAAADLLVAADDRIDLSLLRFLDEVDAVLLERLVGRLRVLVGDIRHARCLADRVDRGLHALAVDAERREHFLRAALHIGKRNQQVLGRHIRVLHLLRVALGGREDLHQLARCVARGRALHLGQPAHLRVGDARDARDIDARLLEDRARVRALLAHKRGEKVQRRDLGVGGAGREVLGCGHGFLREGCELVESHGGVLSSFPAVREVEPECKARASRAGTRRAVRVAEAVAAPPTAAVWAVGRFGRAREGPIGTRPGTRAGSVRRGG